ncbi:MAG: NUDIX domain-containing protein [Parachlamydiaceae bacterium]|nr:NUDIX domain-containing protein [Parachlamydiaceae bacterium]
MPQYFTDKLKEVTRIGAYGIALKEDSILLVDKIQGPYTGLLDLPGGGVESGEHPEDTLKREFVEEVAMEFRSMTFVERHAFQLEVNKDGENFHFYHFGYLYRVAGFTEISDALAEETFGWYPISTLDLERLTPFARAAVQIHY